jgi:drug/metabolite transporter (DMT)-like permease
MDQKPQHPLYLTILAFIAIYLVWGSTYLFIAFAVQEIPPFFMAGIRFLIAAIIIFVLSPFFIDWSTVKKKQVLNAAQAGIWFLVLGNGAMTWALQYIDTGFASLMISTQPLILLLMMWALDGTKIKLKSVLGILLGLVGMYLLIDQDGIISGQQEWIALGVMVSCLITWGYGSLFVSKAVLPKNHFLNAAIQMSVGAIFLLIAGFIFERHDFQILEVSSFAWLCTFYLVIFGSIIAFTAFNFLLTYVSPEKVATSTYVNPIVAVFLGWYFREELVTSQSILAASILLLGVYFINSSKRV